MIICTSDDNLYTEDPITRVLPTLVGGGQPQPPLSQFYHHSSSFYHCSQVQKYLNSTANVFLLHSGKELSTGEATTQTILGRTLHFYSIVHSCTMYLVHVVLGLVFVITDV